jgi:hypothetical protein
MAGGKAENVILRGGEERRVVGGGEGTNPREMDDFL